MLLGVELIYIIQKETRIENQNKSDIYNLFLEMPEIEMS